MHNNLGPLKETDSLLCEILVLDFQRFQEPNENLLYNLDNMPSLKNAPLSLGSGNALFSVYVGLPKIFKLSPLIS